MRPVGVIFRAELMRRWASWLALSLLVALIGGTVLAGVSTAQRTSSAFSRFTQRYGYDAEVFSSSTLSKRFFDLPYVTKVTTDAYFGNGNATVSGQLIPNQYLNVESLPTSNQSSTIKLIFGRLPTQPRDVLIGLSLQQQFGLRLGSIVTVPLYKKSQYQEILSPGYVVPRGPTVHFRVVGVEVSQIDFPSSTPSYTVFTSPSFDAGVGRTIVRAEIVQMRLRHGERDMPVLQSYVSHRQGVGFLYLQDDVSFASTVSQSIQPQATGWWFFALFAALAGFALVGQALSRQSLVERAAYPNLAALGLRPRQLWGLGMIRAALIGVAGAIGSVALAFGVSDLTPVGEARAAAPGVGFTFSGLLFGLGSLIVVAVVLILAAVPSWRAAQTRLDQNVNERPAQGANLAVTALAKAGAPVSAVVGVRNALDRGRGRTRVPVATALVGSIVAVTALVATTVFGASLTHLVRTPPLYGQNWQLDMGNLTTRQRTADVATLRADPEVTRLTWSLSGPYFAVGSVPVQSVLFNVAKGPAVFSLSNGHAPRGDHEIALGATTMSRARLHVGSSVLLTLTTNDGKRHTGRFGVVGTVVLPPTFAIGGLGTGVVMRIHAAEELACPPGPRQAACLKRLIKGASGWGISAGMAPGRAGHAALLRYQHTYSKFVNEFSVPNNIVNFGQAVDFPLLLGVTLALFGAATLAHLLFVSVARRRRQMALLKVLGFVRHQVLAATCWQALTVVVIGLVIGVPLGLVSGRVVWRLFASHLGAVPVSVVPVVVVAGVCAVITLGGVTLALAPGALAVRVRPAEALREA